MYIKIKGVFIFVIHFFSVHDSLENVKDLPHHEEDKEAIPTPSGVASFSLSSVNIPDNALNAVSGSGDSNTGSGDSSTGSDAPLNNDSGSDAWFWV